MRKGEEERTAVAVGNPLCWEVIGRVHAYQHRYIPVMIGQVFSAA